MICGGCCEFPGFFRITPSNTLKVLGPVVRVRAPTPGWGQLASAAWIRPWGVSFGGGHGGSLVARVEAWCASPPFLPAALPASCPLRQQLWGRVPGPGCCRGVRAGG